MRNILFSFLVLFFLSGLIIYPATPSTGLPGIAVSPNGKIVAAGGISRVIYLINPVKMEVTGRIPAMSQVLNLAFNNAGTVLISENRDETLNFFSIKKKNRIKQFKYSVGMTVSVLKNEVVVFFKKSRNYAINFHSMKDGALLRSIPLKKRVSMIGLDPDHKRLIILSKGPKNMEKVVRSSAIPKDLKGLDRDKFKMMNDGKTSIFSEYDPVSGRKIFEKTIYYSVSQYSKIVVNSNEVFIFTFGNRNAKISKEGEVTLFKKGKHFNYGIGISSDRKNIATGGLRRGVIFSVNSEKSVNYNVPSIPGWPEYLKGFAFAKNGKIFAGTSAFRLLKFNEKGELLKAISVY